MVRLTIEKVKAAVAAKGGQCLTNEYKNGRSRLLCRCGVQAHKTWYTDYNHIRDGKWCPECGVERRAALQRRYTLEDMRALAKGRGGDCRSTEFVSSHALLDWVCQLGHTWSASFHNVGANKSWCPACANDELSRKFRLPIEAVRKDIADHGGELISQEYLGYDGPITIRCGEGHEWTTKLRIVRAGSWCPECSKRDLPDRNGLRLTIEFVRAYIESKSGKLLSETYANVYTPLDLECAEGHRWSAPLGSVRHMGYWCPECSRWKRERECRDVLQELLGVKFPQMTPAWVAGRERLDGYNAELALAFEHNGEQHYRYVPFFHRNGEDDLVKQQKRDRAVGQACDDNWVTLLVIPYWVPDIRAFLKKELELLGYLPAGKA